MDKRKVGRLAVAKASGSMRQLIPVARDEPLDALYLDLQLGEGGQRPYLYVNMVSSADGAATIGGRSRGLGGEADRIAFRRLRETADAILVGAGTARDEDYRPPRLSAEGQQRRRARGQALAPRLVVVTGRVSLDPAARMFSDPENRPLIVTTERSGPRARAMLQAAADILTAGAHEVDFDAALRRLREMGIRRLLCEGGPTLNAALISRGLVDELFLTIAPIVVGRSPHRIVTGDLPGPRRLALRELREHRGELLTRYAFEPSESEP
ncbi:MAG: dihydrofolate reductase family protein [Armatimonadota bacterium]|nr:dihydrofolate reductase family protein [Armatimonadota bacterium]